MAPTTLSSLRNLTSKILSIIPSSPSHSSASPVQSTIAEEIEKLRILVSSIQATVIDAEEQDIADESVKLWLLDLKQVAYDAEHILNDFNYELLSIEVENKLRIKNPKRKYEVIDSIVSLTFDDSILLRIKKFVQRFEEISQLWAVLSLEKVDGVRKSLAPTRHPSSSFINSTETFGRHDIKNHIINSMLPIDEHGSDHVKVISILSMGGMGKTTLAKLVYNNEMVEQHFDVRSWVWVSECFDEVAISRSILESIVNTSCDFLQLDHLQIELKKNLRGKRFLVVLDDLWNDDPTRWTTVLGPLLYGASAKGSCILITTRNSKIAKIGSKNLVIPLGGLPKNDSWALFCYYAFSGVYSDNLPQNLVTIGQKIVTKCNGVPLLIKTLGCLLAHETEEDGWDYILKSNVWELEECKTTIIPILKLSYVLLPSHLKPCFTYCAAFPKGSVFELENLVHLWIAQGFIQKHPKRKMEEVGLMYAHDLLQRSFFEDLSAINSSYKVTMHDLMHDLAQSITSEEILITENEQLDGVGSRKHLRHLTILVNQEGYVSLKNRLDGISLKSLIIIGSNEANFSLEESFFDNRSFTNLFVLDLNFWASNKVPNSISNLKHLRYVGLSGQKLPESMCDLYHLETLNLRTSKGKCKFESTIPLLLPRNIDHLINLRHLIVDPWDISMMPQGIGSLTNLQSLSLFALSQNHESASLRELKSLNNLRGTLEISNLHKTMHEQSLEANLGSKKHLNRVVLSFRKEFFRSLNKKNYVLPEVLKCLRPHTNIQQVTVKHYEGEQLPSWFLDHSFSRLANLNRQDCTECKQLPAIGQLPHLKYLKLEIFSSLENVGSELLGNGIIACAFPSLDVLIIYKMPILVNWFYGKNSDEIFPRLREVHLSFCKSLFLFQLPTISPLDKLNVSWCDSLETIYGLEGSWSLISQWKSILDSSKGQNDESISKLHHALNILDSRVLKLQRDSKAGKSLTAQLRLTIVGCPILQRSYLTCIANNNKVTSTKVETLSSNAGEGNGLFLRSIERNLRRKGSNLYTPEPKFEVQLNPTTSSRLSETMTYVRSSILKNPKLTLSEDGEDSDEKNATYKSHHIKGKSLSTLRGRTPMSHRNKIPHATHYSTRFGSNWSSVKHLGNLKEPEVRRDGFRPKKKKKQKFYMYMR